MNKLPFKKIAKSLLISTTFLTGFTHGALAVMPTMTQAQIPIEQIPSDASLEKLMVVQQFDKSMETSRQQLRPMIIENTKKSFAGLMNDEHITTAQKQAFQQAFQQFIQNTMNKLDTPTYQLAYKNAFKETAKATYTQQEVNAMLDFYGSPMGQQIQNKQTQFGLSYMQKIMPTIEQMQQELIKNDLPKFIKDIEKIKKSS